MVAMRCAYMLCLECTWICPCLETLLIVMPGGVGGNWNLDNRGQSCC